MRRIIANILVAAGARRLCGNLIVRADARVDARLKLAKLTGVIQAHPGLNLAIEGYTDTTGSADLNLKLSQQRADAVGEFRVSQGLPANTIIAIGLGKRTPSQTTRPLRRQANRRVEIIVSDQVIGARIGK